MPPLPDQRKMNRRRWKNQGQVFVSAAGALLANRHWTAAYHLAGVAVECALKAAICRSVRTGDWPDRNFVQSIHSHDLAALVRHAQLDGDRHSEESRSPSFRINWSIVKDWTIDSRYKEWTEAEATDMVGAVSRRETGVFPWIKKHW